MSSKIYLNFSIVLAAALVSACSVKVADVKKPEAPNEPKPKAEEIKVDLHYIGTTGGQPGKIQIRGQAVKLDEKNKPVLDQRISVSQTAGKNKFDVPKNEVSESQKASLSYYYDNTTIDKEKLKDTYINLNCENVEPDQVVGLKEIKPSFVFDHMFVDAKVVFLCKNVRFLSGVNSISITADSVVMDNMSSTIYGSSGDVSILTNKLTLIGKNKLATQGPNQVAHIFEALGIAVEVHEALQGDGTLEVSSTGGTRIDENQSIKVRCEVVSIEAGKEKVYIADLDSVNQGHELNLNFFNIQFSLKPDTAGVFSIYSVQVDNKAKHTQMAMQSPLIGFLSVMSGNPSGTVDIGCRIL